MQKLETLIELKRLEKANRRNRLEKNSRKQDYYGEIEELFDPLTKTLNAYREKISIANQTLETLKGNDGETWAKPHDTAKS